MSESLAINSIVQTKLATWLAAKTLSWTPRILTGFRRISAGEVMSAMESAGEVDTVIIECANAVPIFHNSQFYIAQVHIRIRHDCDHVLESVHSTRVNEIAALIQDYPTFRDALNALPDFNASQIKIESQAQTSSGRSYETTLMISMEAIGKNYT